MRIIAGKFKGKKIISPTSKGTRPTSDRAREMIFNILLHNPAFGDEDLLNKNVLDVFAGTGALGLEAFSRGAKSVFFIENNPMALSTLQANLQSCSLSPLSILKSDARYLGKAPFPFDLIFLDPPYGQNLLGVTLNQLIAQEWLSPGAWIIMEFGKDEDFQCPPFLSLVTERHVGSTKVLFCLFQEK
jgi:16S rRNA (guanine966-N2)-methyltransferase